MPENLSKKALHSRILKSVSQANRDFGLINPGDRILVAMSGGKDSYGMLWALERVAAALPGTIELFPFHLDQGQPGHDVTPLRTHLEKMGRPFEIEYQDTYTRVVEKTEPGKIYCSLCSRYRRAILYRAAIRHGCNKVALGHHRDDLIETLLLNIFFSGQIKAMPARLVSERGTHEVIRPLCYVPEEQLVALAELEEFVIMPCQLCGSQQKERAFVKGLLSDLSKRSRHVKGNLLAALGNVRPTHLLDLALSKKGSDAAEGAEFNAALELGEQQTQSAPGGCSPRPAQERPTLKVVAQ